MKNESFRVLLIEPDKDSLMMEKKLISSIDFVKEIIALPTPLAALNILSPDNKFSVIFTCVHTPLLTSFDFMESLSKRDLLGIPVIMISTDQDARQKAINSGAFAFLQKPLELSEVKEALTQAKSMIS